MENTVKTANRYLMGLEEVETPALILDAPKMQRNINRLRDHIAPFKATLRPHIKTVKSREVARRLLDKGCGPATVSTLKEAEELFAMGVKDIIYAVGIVPQKLERVLALRSKGCDLCVVLDSIDQAQAVVNAGAANPFSVLIEIDCDGHRSGLLPDDTRIQQIGQILTDGGQILKGVLTHAGESYEVAGKDALEAFAEKERAAAVQAAGQLTKAGLPCEVVSVGSTPTAHYATNLDGVTEVRAGVYVFFDLVMAGVGVCSLDDIALSVLTTVVGHQDEKGWVIVDAGWTALSQDRGTSGQAVDQEYGVVCDIAGTVMPNLRVSQANQEHGIIFCDQNYCPPSETFPIGTKLRILPNHACATAAQFDAYTVIGDDEGEIVHWPRFRGW